MISAYRKRRAERNANKIKKPVDVEVEVIVPELFRCPISLELMKDPVTLATGITYDREHVERWIYEEGKTTCPVTGVMLTSLEPVPNHTIRRMIQDWCVANKSCGFDRIPTPRAPASSAQVVQILSKMVSMRGNGNADGVRELVVKIKDLARESERSKRCIVSNGTPQVLIETLEAFSYNQNQENYFLVLEEILSGLIMLLPFDQETKSGLWSNGCLRTIVKILKLGSLSGQRNAVLVLKELLSFDQTKLEEFADIEGSIEALAKLIIEPIDPTTTNASLLAIYHLVTPTSCNQKETLVTRFLEMGLTEKLIQTLIDCTRGVCEKALGILEGLCSVNEGLEKAYANALTVPVLVKKLLRVSDVATEFSVSILWKLSKYAKSIGEEEGVAMEALQVGAFQKVLLLLQVGSSLKTKEKACDLLKEWNLHRGKVECIESMDFKNLKRPF